MINVGLSKKKKSKKADRMVLVLDIGSDSVAGALVVLTQNKKPRVVYATRRMMVFQEDLNFDRFVSSMFETLKLVLQTIERKSSRYLNLEKFKSFTISSALCMYASPWYVSNTKVLKLAKDEPFTISQSFIDEIIKKEESKFAKQNTDATQKVGRDSEVIERAVTSVKINGYTVSDIDGKEAKELEFTLSASLAPKNIIKRVEEVVQETFNIENIVHHSFALAAFTSLRDIFHRYNQFVLLDVGGEISDVSLIKDNSLLDTLSFPKGKHFLIRGLMSKLGMSPQEAQSFLKMYADKTLSKAMIAKSSDALAEIQNNWSTTFVDTLRRIQQHLSMPTKLFFIADTEILPLIKQFIQGTEEGSFLDPHPIEFADLREHIDITKAPKNDPFIAIGSIFFNKIS